MVLNTSCWFLFIFFSLPCAIQKGPKSHNLNMKKFHSVKKKNEHWISSSCLTTLNPNKVNINVSLYYIHLMTTFHSLTIRKGTKDDIDHIYSLIQGVNLLLFVSWTTFQYFRFKSKEKLFIIVIVIFKDLLSLSTVLLNYQRNNC